MTSRTGIQISRDVDMAIDDKLCDVVWYLGIDIDARLRFYDKYMFADTSIYGDEMPTWLKVAYEKQFRPYRLFLFDFCFGDLNEDFISKVKEGIKQHPHKLWR